MRNNKSKNRNGGTRKQTKSATAKPAAASTQVKCGGACNPITGAKSLAREASAKIQALADCIFEVGSHGALSQAAPKAGEIASAPEAVPPGALIPPSKPYRTIKLGIDVHLDRYVVVRQIEGGAPQPTQGFSPAQFLQWVAKQVQLAQKVYS